MVFSWGDGTGQDTDGLAGVESGLVAGDELGVLAAMDAGDFAVGELHILSCDDVESGLGGDGDDSVGAVRDFALIWLGVSVAGVGLGVAVIALADHAAHSGVECFERAFLVTEHAAVSPITAEVTGVLDCLMRFGGVAEGVAERDGLFEVGHAGGVVAGGVALAAVVLNGVAGDEVASTGTQCAIGVGAQFCAQSSEAATVVVGIVNQVTEIERGAGLGGGELDAALLVTVIKLELVVTTATEFFGANTP